jgi:photosystem II stability/assembly factor-like uncharacterized protein
MNLSNYKGVFTMNVFCRAFSFAFYVLLFYQVTNAKWIQTGGSTGGSIRSLASAGNCIFAVTYLGGIYISKTDGSDWSYSAFAGSTIHTIASNGATVFAGGDDGFYMSTSGGLKWNQIRYGDFKSCFVSGDTILAGDYKSISRSTDNGKTWTKFDCGESWVDAISVNNEGTIYAGIFGGGLLQSNDNGLTWTEVDAKLPDSYVNAILIKGNIIIVGTNFGAGISTDDGLNWNTIKALDWKNICSITMNRQGVIFAAAYKNGIYSSSDDGAHWTEISQNLPCLSVMSLAAGNTGSILAGMETGAGIFKSTDNGSTWTEANTGLKNARITSFTANSRGELLVGTAGHGIFRIGDNGEGLINANTGLKNEFGYVTALATKGNTFFAVLNDIDGICKSIDGGRHWDTIRANLSDKNYSSSLAVSGDGKLFMTNGDMNVFRSADDGASWSNVGSSLTLGSFLYSDGGNMYLACWDGLFRYVDSTVWKKTNDWKVDSKVVDAITTNKNFVFIGNNDGIFRSGDTGATWSKIDSGQGYNIKYVRALAADGDRIFAGSSIDGVFFSTNNGETWTAVNDGFISNNWIDNLFVAHDTIFAGTGGCGVWVRPIAEFSLPIRMQDLKAHGGSSYFELQSMAKGSSRIIVRLHMSRSEHVSIKVFDINGALRAVLTDKFIEKGNHDLIWNSQYNTSGCFLMSMQTNGSRQVKLMNFLK